MRNIFKNHSIKKTAWIITSIVLAFIIAIFVYEFTFSISGTPVSNKVVFQNEMAWNYDLVYNYKGHDYIVTKNTIPSSLIGNKIDNPIWNGHGEEYEIYSIKTELTYKQIAIKTKYGYLIANKGKKYNLA